jgi:hypothetical protein
VPLHRDRSHDIEEDTPAPDFRLERVIGLSKNRLRAEVFRLDGIIASCKREIEFLVTENIKLADHNAELVTKNSERLDSLLAKQEEILDSRLGLNQPVVVQGEKPKPLGRNRNWQRDFEAKRREEYWKKVVDETEKKDGKLSQGETKAETN